MTRMFLMSHVSSERALGVYCSRWDQDIDFDTAPLPREPRKTAEEHPVIRTEHFRGLKVIAAADSDTPLDSFWVELFGHHV